MFSDVRLHTMLRNSSVGLWTNFILNVNTSNFNYISMWNILSHQRCHLFDKEVVLSALYSKFDLVTALLNAHKHLYKRMVTSLHQIWAILKILKDYFGYFGHLIGLQLEQH